RGLTPPITLTGAKDTLYAYANTYTAKSEGLSEARYKADDTAFSGGVLGTIGGLTKSPQVALAGAAAAGGAGLYSQRYALQIQASNYLGAAQAMECMAAVLVYGKGGDGTEEVRDLAEPGITDADVDFPFLNERINDVRRKL